MATHQSGSLRCFADVRLLARISHRLSLLTQAGAWLERYFQDRHEYVPVGSGKNSLPSLIYCGPVL
jgi:hypothetical protein